jgi:hypothetical protein
VSQADPFEYDDAAYVLGALSPAETEAFEQHLRSCPTCSARVREIRHVPDLLAGISAAQFTDATEQPPETLLPGLLRRAAAQRRRQHWLVGVLAAAAAACLIALAVAVWPSASAQQGPKRNERSFAAVLPSPVRATATLTARAWGTAIDVHCHYATAAIDRTFRYALVVYGKNGQRDPLGSWSLPPDKDIDFAAGTWLPPAQISRVDITLPNGTTVLRLTT